MEYEQYRDDVFNDVLKMKISPEHAEDLVDDRSYWERTVLSCYKQKIPIRVCADVLFWQDNHNLWGKADEIEAEKYVLEKLTEIQKKHDFKL